MKDEIAAAVVFLSGIVRRNKNLNQEQLSKFSDNLAVVLIEKFRNHWYEDKPSKGQGFRCIRVNGDEPRDTVLLKVSKRCGLDYSDLKLPVDLTLWVDPHEVSCRFGEKGTMCPIASFPRKDMSSPQQVPESSSTGSSPVSSDSESDTETNNNLASRVIFRPNTIFANDNSIYRRVGRQVQHRPTQSTYVERQNHWTRSREQYRWVNNSVVVRA